MKKYFLLFIFFALTFGCAKKESVEPADPKEAATKSRTINGEWFADKGGAGGTGTGTVFYDSFKNFQYNFVVGADNQEVSIELSSKVIDVQLVILDPNGTKIYNSFTNRLVTRKLTLNSGTYRMIACAERRAVGKFECKITGVLKDPTIIESKMLQSSTQNWGTLGGGGGTKSPKNQFYTFEVTDDNTSIDVELESADTDVYLTVFNELGQSIFSSFVGSRYEFTIQNIAKRGVYRLMAATATRGSVGKYQFNVIGKVSNLKKEEAPQVETVTGRWANGAAVDTYSLSVSSKSNSPLDLELSSADVNVNLELQTSAGNRIVRRAGEKSIFIVSDDLAPGNYRIAVTPWIVTTPGVVNGFGNYTLTVHGQFANLKKL